MLLIHGAEPQKLENLLINLQQDYPYLNREQLYAMTQQGDISAATVESPDPEAMLRAAYAFLH